MFKIGALFVVIHACLLAGSFAYKASSNVYQGEAYHNNTSGKRVTCDLNLDNKDLLLATVSVLRNSTAGCDTCIRVQGPQGSIVAKVAEQCHDCDENFVQLTAEAFNRIHTANSSLVNVSWEVVDCALLGSDVHQELPGADKNNTTADSEDDNDDDQEDDDNDDDAEDDQKDGGKKDCEDNCDNLQNGWLKDICRRACQNGKDDNPERPVNPRWFSRNLTTRGGLNSTSYNATNSTGQQTNSTLNITNLIKNWASNTSTNATANASAAGGDYTCSASKKCPESGHCCSKYGYCGTSSEHCGVGCIGGACLGGSNNNTSPLPKTPTPGNTASENASGVNSNTSQKDDVPTYGSTPSGDSNGSVPTYGSSHPSVNKKNESKSSNNNGTPAADCPSGSKSNGSASTQGPSNGGAISSNGTTGCPTVGGVNNSSAGCLPKQPPSGNYSTPLPRTNLTASTTLLSNSSTATIALSTTTPVLSKTPYIPSSDAFPPIGDSATESRSEAASTSAAGAPSQLLTAVFGMIMIIVQIVMV
ncbi:hypothetical protein MP228_005588 [Amoeboaphelidium protococcarum]|nr:hypothetical protein MP228_005588 [Amoeboaphelidium protococcarum]